MRAGVWRSHGARGPAGVRLVMAALVPADGGPADPATIRLAWIPVAAANAAEANPS